MTVPLKVDSSDDKADALAADVAAIPAKASSHNRFAIVGESENYFHSNTARLRAMVFIPSGFFPVCPALPLLCLPFRPLQAAGSYRIGASGRQELPLPVGGFACHDMEVQLTSMVLIGCVLNGWACAATGGRSVLVRSPVFVLGTDAFTLLPAGMLADS